jgi:hypothetical protein
MKKYQILATGLLAMSLSAIATCARAATLTHLYSLDNTYADSNGGENLNPNGGTLTPTGGYDFAAGQGLSLNNSIDNNAYSIVLDFAFTDPSSGTGYKKIVDFKNLTSDDGLYQKNAILDFYRFDGITESEAIGTTPLNSNLARAILTRDNTGTVAGYINGNLEFSFNDLSGAAIFDQPNSIAHFFNDDSITNGAEISGGFLRRIAIFNGALDPTEIANLDLSGATAVPEPIGIVGTVLGGFGAVWYRRRRSSKE